MDSDINYIIQESLNGDKNYQEILLEKLNPLLFKNIYMYWNLMDPMTEDLLQEGYAVILQALKTFDNSRNVHFLHYIKTKIEYFFKNYYKKTKKQLHDISLSTNIGQYNLVLEKTVKCNLNTLESVIMGEASEELMKNIKKLTEKEQKIIYLYYYDEQPLTVISKNLNIPYRTVIGKKKTALKKLKRLFQEVR